MFTLWFDCWNCYFDQYTALLDSKGIRYEWVIDEHVTYGDGVIFTFYSDEDLETASDIYLDM
ncbi:hypothetical protein 65p214 [Aeromonas phage 65]|uniref:Uncharacterized protein n=2 Tax=Ishigurovirus osborne TaxID=260149 RepID=A0A219YC70_9CAUD|nr:hypothetical protein ST65p214 [Aeromonas phage 65]ADQ53222.1 hypothetical protein 65p214 [Aeromonas phage 65]APU01598.1 hypothetical protein [Aeromonas phage 65.2]